MGNHMKSGSIEFITGVMNSCKSYELIKRIDEARDRGLKYLILKPSVDVRDGVYVKSRMTDAKYQAISVDEANTQLITLITDFAKHYDVIFIDEVQFFSAEFMQKLIDLTFVDGVAIVASGLMRDFKEAIFPASQLLRIYATEDIIFRKSHCYCCGEPNGVRYATVDVRMDAKDKIVTEGVSVSIEGTDTSYHYETVCRRCYNEKLKGDY